MMGEFQTKFSVWIAFGAWALGSALYWSRRNDVIARLSSTIGCIALLIHVLFAFHFYHAWSHQLALLDTARQTSETIGIDWSGGLYINYAFATAWLIDTGWWWWGLSAYRERHQAITTTWHLVSLFMFFNATVVFGAGSLRWIGLLVCASVALALFFGCRRKEKHPLRII